MGLEMLKGDASPRMAFRGESQVMTTYAATLPDIQAAVRRIAGERD